MIEIDVNGTKVQIHNPDVIPHTTKEMLERMVEIVNQHFDEEVDDE